MRARPSHRPQRTPRARLRSRLARDQPVPRARPVPRRARTRADPGKWIKPYQSKHSVTGQPWQVRCRARQRAARGHARVWRGGGGALTAREGVARGLTGALEEKTLREGKDAPRGGSSKWKLSPSLVVRSRTQAHPYPRGRRQADIAYERFLAPEIFFAPEIYNSQYIKPLPVRPSEPSQLNPRASSARALWP